MKAYNQGYILFSTNEYPHVVVKHCRFIDSAQYFSPHDLATHHDNNAKIALLYKTKACPPVQTPYSHSMFLQNAPNKFCQLDESKKCETCVIN